MNEKIPFFKKYDRSVVMVATAVATLIVTYLSIGRNINDLVAGTPCVNSMKERMAINTNRLDTLEKGIERFDKKLDMLIMRVGR
jgi:hypothetical protein